MKYDVYLYEDCRVLKNKLNLIDEAELDKAESEFASKPLQLEQRSLRRLVLRQHRF